MSYFRVQKKIIGKYMHDARVWKCCGEHTALESGKVAASTLRQSLESTGKNDVRVRKSSNK
jgi:hypothetical protein